MPTVISDTMDGELVTPVVISDPKPEPEPGCGYSEELDEWDPFAPGEFDSDH